MFPILMDWMPLLPVQYGTARAALARDNAADAGGQAIYRKKLSRAQFARFLVKAPRCVIAMEACASAHHWGREAQSAGHEVRLVPAGYVKPFVKRHKSDAVDAEAIVEAALRPSMRFVPVKAPEQQA